MDELKDIINKIKVILKLNGEGFDYNYESDYELFIYLCKENKLTLIELLIDNGFDVNISNPEDLNNVLNVIKFADKIELLELLLKNKVNTHHLSSYNIGIFDYRDTYENIDIIKLLIKYNVDFSYISKSKLDEDKTIICKTILDIFEDSYMVYDEPELKVEIRELIIKEMRNWSIKK